MRSPSNTAANPFGLMLNPEAVLEQVAHSERLSRLQRRVCRPLDKPLLAGRSAADSAQADFDRLVDAGMDTSAEPDAARPGEAPDAAA